MRTAVPRRILRLGALGLVLALGAACGTLLGIEDRNLDTTGGDGGGDGGGGVDGAGDTSVGDGMVPGETGSPDATPTGDGGGTDTGMPNVDASTCPTPCVIAKNLDVSLGVAADSTNVYWTEFGDGPGAVNGYVKGCPVAGCAAGGPLVYAMGQANPEGIATDGVNVYWATRAAPGGGGGIWSCPIAGCGGSPKQLTTADTPEGIAVDALPGGYVYWVGGDGLAHRVLKAGGTSLVVWDGVSGGVNNLLACAVDDTSLYFIDDWTDVLKAPIGGGTAVTLNLVPASGNVPLGNWNIAVDSTRAYYGTMNAIDQVAKAGADGGAKLTGNLQQPWAVTVDKGSGAIYWADFGSGAGTDGIIGRVQPDGGSPTPLVTSLTTPVAIALGGPYVFWVSKGAIDSQGTTMFNTGAVYRASK